MDKPHISRIRIYPVKSLDPVELQEAEMGIHSFKYDREFAMLAEDGRFVNGKRTGRVNELKAEYDLPNRLITLSHRNGGDKRTFELDPENEDLLTYLIEFFGLNLHLLQRSHGELMDMPRQSSVTILSTASLESLQESLEDHPMEDLRLRFRANLEIGGANAFWEEQLFGEPGTGVAFRVGNVEMVGVSPRARCNVPPRNPLTGETDKQFVRRMLDHRARTLPVGSLLQDYANLYYLTVNTFLPESQAGKILRVGDPVEILGPVKLD